VASLLAKTGAVTELADPAAPPLTLRGVARAAGVAATSVYLHFADTDALLLAVADKHFGELVQAQQAAGGGRPHPDPRRAAFEQRTEAVAAALDAGGGSANGGQAFRASLLIWQLLHGTVGLRISRSVFPWPPVTETVTRGVALILDGALAA
jgi:hypothetical protein